MNIPDAYDGPSGLAAVHMSIEDLLSFMNDFPALLWRIEIAKSRIEFLNNNYIVSNGLDGKLLLKNIQYQRDVVIPEDAYLLGAFMDSVKKGKTAATIFRARCTENRIAWLKITGATNSWDPRYSYGFLLNVTDTVEQIKAILDKDEPWNVIGRTNIPILAPREHYERIGDVPNLVFSCGAIIEPDNSIKLYYGAANSCVCLGTTTVDEIVEACNASEKEF